MNSESKGSGRPLRTQPQIGESITEYRVRVAYEQEEMQQRRLLELAEQVSAGRLPAERIGIWERLHGLSLPRNPTHKLVRVIAAATDLQLKEVQEVQRLRLSAASGTPAKPAEVPPES